MSMSQELVGVCYFACFILPQRDLLENRGSIELNKGSKRNTVDRENFISSKVSKEKFSNGFNFIHLSIIRN